MGTLFDKVANLIGANKIKEAIELLDSRPLSLELRMELVILKSGWRENEAKNRKGIFSDSEYSIARNKILASLLELAQLASEASNTPLPAASINLPTPPENIGINNSAEVEKIIGKSTLTTVEWFSKMVVAAKSVCRVVVKKPDGNSWKGTGFITGGAYLFTNQHVLEGPDDAKYALLEFNYVSDDSKKSVYKLDPSTWIGDEALDFARVKIIDDPENKLAQWGELAIDNQTTIQRGDAVPIIQHPMGEVQQVSVEGNFVERISPDDKFIYYTTDTLPGSSGSPVFNLAWKVIALHHASMSAEDLNRGILFKKIIQFLDGHNRDGRPDIQPSVPNLPTTGKEMQITIKIFWMYDESAHTKSDQLKLFFAIKERNKEISIFDMHKDTVGMGDKDQIFEQGLDNADWVICIITPMFMVTTMDLAEKAKAKNKRIIPVLISPAPIGGTFLERLVTLPSIPKIVSEWPNEDAAYFDIYKHVSRALGK